METGRAARVDYSTMSTIKYCIPLRSTSPSINRASHFPSSPQLDLKYAELELEHDKLQSERGGRATLVSEANAGLLEELERCSSQLKDTLRENGELKTLYLQVNTAV